MIISRRRFGAGDFFLHFCLYLDGLGFDGLKLSNFNRDPAIGRIACPETGFAQFRSFPALNSRLLLRRTEPFALYADLIFCLDIGLLCSIGLRLELSLRLRCARQLPASNPS